jgi:hypothetical protein
MTVLSCSIGCFHQVAYTYVKKKSSHFPLNSETFLIVVTAFLKARLVSNDDVVVSTLALALDLRQALPLQALPLRQYPMAHRILSFGN